MNKTLAFFIIFSLLLIVLGMNRGFDFSDEGLYVLLADPLQQNEGGIFNYDLFFKLIYQMTGWEFGIVGLRVIRLLSYFAAAFGLTIFWKNFTSEARLSFPIFLLGLSGLFGGYGFLPPALSYNSISVVAVCFWLAIISKKQLSLMDCILLGLVLCALFYSKITTCLILAVLTFAYIIRIGEMHLKKIILIFIPLVIFECLFYLLFRENALTRLTDDLGFLNQRQDYTVFNLLKYTAVGVFWISLSGFFFLLASRMKRLGVGGYYLVLSLTCAVFAWVCYITFITFEWSHIILLLTFAGISWQLGQLDNLDLKRQEFCLVLVLILLPFLLHFGSNVYWMRLGIHYWVFWLLALAYLIDKNQQIVKDQFYVLTSFTSLLLVFFGIWLTPFEGVYLWNATEKWEYQPTKQILLSTQYIEFLDSLREEFENTTPAKVMALYGNPGILYMLGTNSPYSPGYWKPSQAKLFMGDGATIDLVLLNNIEEFPFHPDEWTIKKELTQPNGEKLQLLWRK